MTANEKRLEAVRLMRSREKKNNYNQARPGYFFGKPEGKNPGRSDCSDTVRQCILRAAGIDIGGNTSAQIDNARRGLGIIIEDNRDGKLSYPTQSKLKPGDAIYYLGNTAHTWGVGHVEMNTDEDECMGHGSGTGPTRKNRKTYSQGRTGNRKYLCTVRWIKDDGAEQPSKLGDDPLTKGCKSEIVRELQKLLLKQGEKLPKYGADGEYGDETAVAVKSYQAKAGLVQTGIADVTTIKSIQAAASGQITSTKQRCRISGGQAWIRKGPGTSFTKWDVAANGTIFELSGEMADGWVGIILNGVKAWISAKYAEIV